LIFPVFVGKGIEKFWFNDPWEKSDVAMYSKVVQEILVRCPGEKWMSKTINKKTNWLGKAVYKIRRGQRRVLEEEYKYCRPRGCFNMSDSETHEL